MQTAAQNYPLPVYNYRVTIDTVVISCSEITGLAVEYGNVIYKHGLSFLNGPSIIRTGPNPVNISLKRAVVPRRNELWRWLEDQTPKTLTIDLCDEKGLAAVRWKVTGALPLKLTAPAFAAATNEVAFESLDLIAPSLTLEYL